MGLTDLIIKMRDSSQVAFVSTAALAGATAALLLGIGPARPVDYTPQSTSQQSTYTPQSTPFQFEARVVGDTYYGAGLSVVSGTGRNRDASGEHTFGYKDEIEIPSKYFLALEVNDKMVYVEVVDSRNPPQTPTDTKEGLDALVGPGSVVQVTFPFDPRVLGAAMAQNRYGFYFYQVPSDQIRLKQ